jgi:type I restriction enzyme R subunit
MNNKENIQTFDKELDFEVALCEVLKQHGWEPEIFNHPTEEELLENWAQIIYENNREQEKLGNAQLAPTEMQQIVDQVNSWHTPYEINKRINAREVCIKRDNKQDTRNYGKDVYLKLFDAKEICAGQ